MNQRQQNEVEFEKWAYDNGLRVKDTPHYRSARAAWHAASIRSAGCTRQHGSARDCREQHGAGLVMWLVLLMAMAQCSVVTDDLSNCKRQLKSPQTIGARAK